MILTDYYRFEKQPDKRSRLRIDCTTSTGGYNPFERMRNKRGELFIYLGDNRHTRSGCDLMISHEKHISSIYCPSPSVPLWYGDFKDTADALLLVPDGVRIVNGAIEEGGIVEVFVARGQRANRLCLYEMACGDELAEEMERLRKAAK